jgi:hypothetical protein
VAAEEFSKQPLDPVAPHRLTQTPGHHQSQSGGQSGRGSQSDPEVARMEPFALGLRPEEIGPTADSIRLGETGSPFNGWGRDGGRAPAGHFLGVAQRSSPLFRLSGVSGPWPDGASRPGVRLGCSSAPESRGFVPDGYYWVDKCASFRIFLSAMTFSNLFIKHLSPSLSRDSRRFSPLPPGKGEALRRAGIFRLNFFNKLAQ